MAFVTELGSPSESTDDRREKAFLSVAVQKFSAELIDETFDFSDGQPDL